MFVAERKSLPPSQPTGDTTADLLSAPQSTRRTFDKPPTLLHSSAETMSGDATPPTSADDRPGGRPSDVSDSTRAIESLKAMSGQIRAAVDKARKREEEFRSNKIPPSLPELETSSFELPPDDIYIELSDSLRECIENKLNEPSLLIHHNEETISLNKLLSCVKEHNQSFPKAPVDIGPYLSKASIVSRREVKAEVYIEALTPAQQLRLRSSERQYQRMVSKTPLFNKLRSLRTDEHGPGPDSLAIELNGSVGMAASLVGGLFLSFLVGFYGPRFLGITDVSKRALIGLVTCILGMGVEVGLILVRYAKLDRIRYGRQQRAARAMSRARMERDQFKLYSSQDGTGASPKCLSKVNEAEEEEQNPGDMRDNALRQRVLASAQ